MVIADPPKEEEDPPPVEETSKGAKREARVAELTGGKVDNRKVVCRPHGTTDIDVLVEGKPLTYVTVGGGAKGLSLPKWKQHLKKLKVLSEGNAVIKEGGKEKPVPPGKIQVYLVEGTSKEVIDAAIEEFGKENVHTFVDVE